MPDALVAMNPAALKTNIDDLPEGGMLVVSVDSFKKMNLAKAGYESNPLEDEDFRKKYHLVELDLTNLTKEALAESPLKPSDKTRCKNFFALGFMYFVYGRPLEPTLKFFDAKWGKKLPEVAEANSLVLKAGYNLGDTLETARNRYQVSKAASSPGVYRKISGNEAMVYGLVVAAKKANRELLYSVIRLPLHLLYWKACPNSRNTVSNVSRRKTKLPLWEWLSEQALPGICRFARPVDPGCA